MTLTFNPSLHPLHTVPPLTPQWWVRLDNMNPLVGVQDGTWGGHLELQAAVMLLQVNICIHQAASPVWTLQVPDLVRLLICLPRKLPSS